jgi:hypothetical protein
MYGHDARDYRGFGLALILELFLLHQKRRSPFSFSVVVSLEEERGNGLMDVS